MSAIMGKCRQCGSFGVIAEHSNSMCISNLFDQNNLKTQRITELEKANKEIIAQLEAAGLPRRFANVLRKVWR